MNQTPLEIVLGFFDDANAGKWEEAFARIDPAVEFWIAGREWSNGGTYDLKGLQSVVAERMMPVLAGPLVNVVTGTTAEGERVAVEVDCTAPTKAGPMYQNQFHWLFVVREGKIVAAKEYGDTLHASIVLFP